MALATVQKSSLSTYLETNFTFSKSSIAQSAHTPGSAANKAEEIKRRTYQSLTDRYRFEPLAIETTGVFGKSTSKFASELGKRISARTGENREVAWLRQRISIAIAKGNALSILATGGNYLY